MRFARPVAIHASADAIQLTLATAVKDAAAGRLSPSEIRDAVSISQVGRDQFDAMAAAERLQLAADREPRELEDAKRRLKFASVRPLTDFYDGWKPS